MMYKKLAKYILLEKLGGLNISTVELSLQAKKLKSFSVSSKRDARQYIIGPDSQAAKGNDEIKKAADQLSKNADLMMNLYRAIARTIKFRISLVDYVSQITSGSQRESADNFYSFFIDITGKKDFEKQKIVDGDYKSWSDDAKERDQALKDIAKVLKDNGKVVFVNADNTQSEVIEFPYDIDYVLGASINDDIGLKGIKDQKLKNAFLKIKGPSPAKAAIGVFLKINKGAKPYVSLFDYKKVAEQVSGINENKELVGASSLESFDQEDFKNFFKFLADNIDPAIPTTVQYTDDEEDTDIPATLDMDPVTVQLKSEPSGEEDLRVMGDTSFAYKEGLEEARFDFDPAQGGAVPRDPDQLEAEEEADANRTGIDKRTGEKATDLADKRQAQVQAAYRETSNKVFSMLKSFTADVSLIIDYFIKTQDPYFKNLPNSISDANSFMKAIESSVEQMGAAYSGLPKKPQKEPEQKTNELTPDEQGKVDSIKQAVQKTNQINQSHQEGLVFVADDEGSKGFAKLSKLTFVSKVDDLSEGFDEQTLDKLKQAFKADNPPLGILVIERSKEVYRAKEVKKEVVAGEIIVKMKELNSPEELAELMKADYTKPGAQGETGAHEDWDDTTHGRWNETGLFFTREYTTSEEGDVSFSVDFVPLLDSKKPSTSSNWSLKQELLNLSPDELKKLYNDSNDPHAAVAAAITTDEDLKEKFLNSIDQEDKDKLSKKIAEYEASGFLKTNPNQIEFGREYLEIQFKGFVGKSDKTKKPKEKTTTDESLKQAAKLLRKIVINTLRENHGKKKLCN